MYVRVGRRTLLSLALDVRKETTGRPLPIVHYTLQIVHGRTWGDHCTYVRYFLEYPLDNTWTYDLPFGPLCKLYQTYIRAGECPLLFQGVGSTS
jgi:hypothetical protein